MASYFLGGGHVHSEQVLRERFLQVELNTSCVLVVSKIYFRALAVARLNACK